MYRTVAEIKEDIDKVRRIVELLQELSWVLGYGGKLHSALIDFLSHRLSPSSLEGVFLVWRWIREGGKSIFIQDADSLIMRTPHLIEALLYLKRTFPFVERITSYARSRSLYKKGLGELKDIRSCGLVRLHIGLESGDDEILRKMKKGASSNEHINAGQWAKEAGFEVSEYIMPGLGGRDRSREHALSTAQVLNKIGPHFVRCRPLVPRYGTPLYRWWEEGRFSLLSPHQLLKEMRLMVQSLEFSGRLCFDHMRNPAYSTYGGTYTYLFSQDYNGYDFPSQKEEVLFLIEKGLLIPEEHFLSIQDIMRYEREIYQL